MTQAVEKKPDRIENFIAFLGKQDRAAFAELRRSLSFDPGTYPPSFPPVEPFVMEARGAWERNAFYLIAGLFALIERPLEKKENAVLAHKTAPDGLFALQDDAPEASPEPAASRRSFGHAVAELYQSRDQTPSIEARFIALLDADEEQLSNRLRQLVSLVNADGVRIAWEALLEDVLAWNHERRYVQQRWARDFYGRVGTSDNTVQDAE